MFRYANTISDDKGNALPGWQVECVELDTTTVVPIFSDENETPIQTVSGVENRAVADTAGNYEFYVNEGTYSLRFYDGEGLFKKAFRYFTMYGNAADTVQDAVEAAANLSAEFAASITAPSGEVVPVGIYPAAQFPRIGATITRFVGKVDGATTVEVQIGGVTVHTATFSAETSETVELSIAANDSVDFAVTSSASRTAWFQIDGVIA